MTRKPHATVPIIALSLLLVAGPAPAETPLRDLATLAPGTAVSVLGPDGARKAGVVTLRDGRKVVVIPQRRRLRRPVFFGGTRGIGRFRGFGYRNSLRR